MSTRFIENSTWLRKGLLGLVASTAMFLSACSDDDNDPVASCSGTIAEIAECNGDFDILYAAVVAAGLGETLSGGEYTVFAPTDAAFTELFRVLGTTPAAFLEREDLANILLYHVLGEEVVASDAIAVAGSDMNTATTAESSQITLSLEGENLFVNRSQVVAADVDASNGVIHAINKVLIPPGYFNVVETAQADGRFTTLVAAVVQAGLADTLASTPNLTVFAPTDDAFAELIASNDSFSSEQDILDLTNLADILKYHVLSSAVGSDTAVSLSGETTPTLNEDGDLGISFVDPDLFINNAKVVVADVETSNGFIHAIDRVLLPSGDDELSDTSLTIAGLVTSLAEAETGAQFTVLLEALAQEGLASALAGEGPFTVFAPTDAAFAAVGTTDEILELENLADILQQHVISGAAVSSVEALAANGTSVETLLDGTSLSIEIDDDRNLTVGNATVVITDVQTSNGVVHVIDQVITEP